MRGLLILCLFIAGGFLFVGKAEAATYYVDSSITDTNVASAIPDFTTYDHAAFTTTGGSDSVYKTIADINTKTFSPGDMILFRTTQSWNEIFTVKSSGNSSASITYGSFGTGSNPVIKGVYARLAQGGGSYSVFQDLDFSNPAGIGFDWRTWSNVTLNRVNAFSSSGSGISFDAETDYPSNVTITNSTAHNNGNRGIWLVNAGTSYITNTEVYSNTTNGISVSPTTNSTAIVNGCRAHDNSGFGLATAGGTASQIIYENNRVWSNADGGIRDHTAVDHIFKAFNNVVYNNGNEGIWTGSDDTTLYTGYFYNNTIYGNNLTGLDIKGVGTYTVKNNIIFHNDEVSPTISYQITWLSTGSTLISDYNVIGTQSTGRNIYLRGAGVMKTVTTWKQYSSGAYDQHSVEGDPLFVNAGAYDFRLQAISPAKDTGVAISDITTDYLGTAIPRGSAPDIGAYEYDAIAPILSSPSSIGLTNDNTPNFTFTTDEAGTILYAGDCSSTATSTTVGANTITFSTLADGAHSNCKLSVIDPAGNDSATTTITSFTVDTISPVLTETTPVSALSNDTTPSYVFSTTEAGTLLYAGSCAPGSTSISSGSNTVTFNTLSDGTYTNCKLSVIDGASNNSATTTLASFTVETVAPVSTVSVSGSTYSNTQSVSLSCSDAGSGCDKIYYTTNGSTPTTSSQTYSNPITIVSGYTSLKFFATDLTGNSEAVKTENYSIITGSVPVAPAPAGSTPAQAQTTAPATTPATSATDNTNNPPQPSLVREGVNTPITATVEQMQTEALRLAQGRPTEILANFVTSGTPTTLILGSGERSGVVNSFQSAFGRAPQTEADWSDVIKIANGRWPSQTNQTTETNATAAFRKIYNRAPNLKQANDNAAVTVISYGLRPSQRNLNSEKAAIKSFKFIYGHAPKSAMAWDIVRAIAYSGAKR